MTIAFAPSSEPAKRLFFLTRTQHLIARSDSLLCVPCQGALVPWVTSPIRQLSLQPETPGADQEVTNGLKHIGKSALKGCSGLCGPQRERTLSRPRKASCGGRPAIITGKSDTDGEMSDLPEGPTGVVVAARIVENQYATGEVCTGGGGWQPSSTMNPQGTVSTGADGGWVGSTDETG